jgi:hypothetical protein
MDDYGFAAAGHHLTNNLDDIGVFIFSERKLGKN